MFDCDSAPARSVTRQKWGSLIPVDVVLPGLLERTADPIYSIWSTSESLSDTGRLVPCVGLSYTTAVLFNDSLGPKIGN
jgi:hypothetical protein